MPRKRQRTRHPKSKVEFLTVAEVASIMRVSKITVYRLLHSGELPGIRVGRSFRVPEQAVYDYLRAEVEAGTVMVAGVRGQSSRKVIRPAADQPTPLSDADEVSLSTVGDVTTIARQVASTSRTVYLTDHGRRAAAIVPADVAAELDALDPDERAEVLAEIRDTVAARRAMESIRTGEQVLSWEDVKARLEL